MNARELVLGMFIYLGQGGSMPAPHEEVTRPPPPVVAEAEVIPAPQPEIPQKKVEKK